MLIFFLIAGCVIVPTVPHDVGVVVNKETFESLHPGETTRADVLLTLGEPRYRFEEDRFLMYEWDVAYGYLIIFYGGAGPVVTVPHYLCLEFGLDARLVRREYLTGQFNKKPDKAIQACTKQREEPK